MTIGGNDGGSGSLDEDAARLGCSGKRKEEKRGRGSRSLVWNPSSALSLLARGKKKRDDRW